MTQNTLSCGIDFGTSNSTCAVNDAHGVRLVPLERGKSTLPSVLFFGDKGDILFGNEAISAYIDGEDGRLLRGLKSVLGTSLMAEKTIIRGKARTFESILATYIAHLKTQAENFTGAVLCDIVMGRPVHFHDDDHDADLNSENILRKIAADVGFKNIHFQFEPIAAAYAHEQNLTSEQIAVVVDLGGGTSDFTVMRLSPEKSQKHDRSDDILATDGVRVGGTNFDRNLSVASFMPYFGLGSSYHSEFDAKRILKMPTKVYYDLSDWPLIHQAQSDKAIRETATLLRTSSEPEKLQRLLHIQQDKLGHALLQRVESTKISLTDHEITDADLGNLGIKGRLETNRTDFLQSIHDLIARIQHCLDECMAQSGCDYNDVGLVILTGGSSELPIINDMVRAKFPHAHISKDDKFGSVGKGLAHNAARIF